MSKYLNSKSIIEEWEGGTLEGGQVWLPEEEGDFGWRGGGIYCIDLGLCYQQICLLVCSVTDFNLFTFGCTFIIWHISGPGRDLWFSKL